MISLNPSRSFLRFTSICIGFLVSLAALHAADKGATKLRFICVSSLPGTEETVLASRDADGDWKEFGKVALRPSIITDWLSAAAGEMHLAVRKDGALESVCSFQYPAGSKRALVALVADTENNSYKAHVIDPAGIKFDKGSVLVVNFSGKNALVALGTNEQKIEPGQHAVIKPGMEEDTTYRQMVSYHDDDDKDVLCHDRHVPDNPESREMLFLMDDKSVVMKVATLPIFGALD
jgi:hypothetical protein